MIAPWLNAFALSGRVNIICCGITQGVASLALGLMLLAFQAVPVQIRNLSIIIFALTQHFEMLS